MEEMTVFEKQHIVNEALKMDVYAIYLRKSRSDDPNETVEDTVKRHKKILTDLAAQKGLYIGEIYQEVISGAESIEGRPEIKRLIQDCYDGKYRGILVVEITRLSRGSSGDAQIIMDCLTYGNRNNGILVVTPTRTYDIVHNSDDAEYIDFELFMSRREYKMINKRMKRGKDLCIVEGDDRHLGGGKKGVDKDQQQQKDQLKNDLTIGRFGGIHIIRVPLSKEI